MDVENKKILDDIVISLKEAGFDPVEQLTGYLETGNLIYITRLHGSRNKIQNIDEHIIKEYLFTLH